MILGCSAVITCDIAKDKTGIQIKTSDMEDVVS